MDYQAAWDYQEELLKKNVKIKSVAYSQLPTVTANPVDDSYSSLPTTHFLLFVEHPPVYTLGKSGSMDNLLLSAAELDEKDIDFFPINRGGDITFHGPGQIVGYPILDLDWFFNDVHRYVRNIEEVVVRTVAEYGLEAIRIPDYTGVWVHKKSPEKGLGKLCAIGVHMSRWVTLHGWAFNVNTSLTYFRHIVPCGIVDDDKSVSSLSNELGRTLDMQEVKEKLKRHFAEVFQCEIIAAPGKTDIL